MHWSVSPVHVLMKLVFPSVRVPSIYTLATSAPGCQTKQSHQSPSLCVNISRSAHGSGWTWFMSREECSLFVIPQDLWKDCSDYKQIWTVINWTHVVMYVALLHAKINTWHTFMGELVVMMSYCKVKPTRVIVVVLWFILLRSSSGKLQSNIKLCQLPLKTLH